MDSRNNNGTDAQTREAEVLYKSLENWRSGANNLHERVQAGNCVYQHAAQVRASSKGSSGLTLGGLNVDARPGRYRYSCSGTF